MNWTFTIGVASTISLFLPVFFITALKLTRHKSFLALFVYYVSVVVYNLLTLQIIGVSHDVLLYWGLANNLLDAPLMLYFFLYYSSSIRFYRRTRWLIIAFVTFEALVIVIKGFNSNAISVILAPGILLTLFYSMRFFAKHGKLAIRHGKATGKAMIAAALVFAYGCYGLLYLMYYVFKVHVVNGVVNEQYVDDTFLIYYLCTVFSSLLLTAGIVFESKRVHKLNELKVTRKELQMIYTNAPKMATPFRTAMLDFEKEHWN
ncbi:MAG: hypothetical protein IPH18_04690 [Chitinophagaceae bacterium]|nr:hypothetical protein [Chitinophagaceae bacterium]MBK8953784.1 hypothetical protein [Chitinophagaceae bacterium]